MTGVSRVNQGPAGEPVSVAPSRGLRAVGVTCGIGSMLVGARQAGFEVVGNIEWRRYYHYKDTGGKNTFTENFPGAFMKYQVDDLTRFELAAATGCDLAIGHPECGLYSAMQGCNNFRTNSPNNTEKRKDPGDIPLFLDLLARLRPRFFVMDDLPKSFLACPMSEYARRLPEYDLFPEWVSNWCYGNIQKSRRRMFMLGSLKSEGWVFRPGEVPNLGTLGQLVGDLPLDPVAGEIPNHDPHALEEACGRGLHMDYLWHRPTYADYRDWMARHPEGTVFEYHSTSGGIKKKPGWYKQRWGGTCAVVDGGSGHTHPLRNLPFTLRERARIQGFPDDFVFYGTRLNGRGEWNHERNIHMVKQTGKAMPVQFCRYVSGQIAAAVSGLPFESSGARLAKPDGYVDEAKRWFCENVGYADQPGACNACWLKATCRIRTDKYKLGVTSVSAREPAAETPAADLVPASVGGPAEPAPAERVRAVRLAAARPPARTVETRVVEFQDRSRRRSVRVERVNVLPGVTPEDYHCRCRFCREVIGELRPEGGGYYSRLERNKYYERVERGKDGHAAKTPLHVARWAVQEYTEPGDWVLDPTAGAGTTIVEAMVQGRSAAGMEIQYKEIISANVRRHAVGTSRAILGFGDARNLGGFLTKGGVPRLTLVVNNPPYSGDESTIHLGGPNPPPNRYDYTYDRDLPNLAFLKEGVAYWSVMSSIYRQAVDCLLPGGHIVVAVKDMMRSRTPLLLHKMLCEVLEVIEGLEFVGTAFLNHYPRTLNLNTYEARYGVPVPTYQTINVFRKKEGTA